MTQGHKQSVGCARIGAGSGLGLTFDKVVNWGLPLPVENNMSLFGGGRECTHVLHAVVVRPSTTRPREEGALIFSWAVFDGQLLFPTLPTVAQIFFTYSWWREGGVFVSLHDAQNCEPHTDKPILRPDTGQQ